MLRRLRTLYLTPRLIGAVVACAVLFVAGHFWPAFTALGWLGTGAIALLTAAEAILLIRHEQGFSIARTVPRRFSNGDENSVRLTLENHLNTRVAVEVIEELPVQFQARGQRYSVGLEKGGQREVTYNVRPTQRGRYTFGLASAYVATGLGLVQRRFRGGEAHEASVYPAFLQLERYQLLAATSRLEQIGVKKMRRLGHTLEFEHIREYTTGDDIRTLNWRASARRGSLMVNQFQDERAQPIYSVIDTGRAMKMPFDGLTLLDHSINAALVLAGVALKKQDLAGLVTYSRSVHTFMRAERRSGQMARILETLFSVTTQFDESDTQRLYGRLRQSLPRRSLLVVFTNFESLSGLRRHLPELTRLANHHVVLCILFENTELRTLTQAPAQGLDRVYVQAIARQFADEKREIARTLRQHGVGTLLTTPGNLTLDVVTRYLELKAQGII